MKITAFFTLLLFLITPVYAQHTFNDSFMRWTRGWTNFNPNTATYPQPDETLPNIIDKDLFLSNDMVYKISGNTYVTQGTTLTIQEGTVIRCDHKNPASLVIAKGGKLIARGSKVAPIIFTSDKAARSRKSGDWGGIIIIGSAPVNTPSGTGIIEGNFNPEYSIFGGQKKDEQTTILSYIRIEYPGKKINASKELNGLTLYAVGSRSIINNIMVSHSADDSFECFGGAPTLENLVSLKAKDDDFDLTMGYTGTLQNIAAIRHPYISDTSGSYAIEIDGYDKRSSFVSSKSFSTVTIHNAALINLSDTKNFQHTTAAISARNMAKIHLKNSRISGFANVIKFDKSYTSYSGIEQSFSLLDSFFNVHNDPVLVSYEPKSGSEQIVRDNRFTARFNSVSELFIAPLSEKKPKFTLQRSPNNYSVMQ